MFVHNIQNGVFILYDGGVSELLKSTYRNMWRTYMGHKCFSPAVRGVDKQHALQCYFFHIMIPFSK
jgi:hypothetical protein